MSINFLSAAKFVASGIVGLGTTKIVGQVIKNNVTAETPFEKITMGAAAWVLGAMVAKATKEYTDAAIDETFESVAKTVNTIKESAKLARINKGESTIEKEGLDEKDFLYNAETSKWLRKDVPEPDSLAGLLAQAAEMTKECRDIEEKLQKLNAGEVIEENSVS
jgi:Asp-tRNA(Asn)/Glu-tRNA(Gln) amidotransferase C subunit